ncbi:MAG TPA: hypothetical protein VKU03_03305 [Roseiarcus sp.]|nr:hypothetical protein [Roseiarcus sp.]
MRLMVQRVGFVAALSFLLGGCLDAVTHPLNPEPTAYEDSLCPHGPPGGEIVNYGCVAGRAVAPAAYHRHRRHRRIVRARY